MSSSCRSVRPVRCALWPLLLVLGSAAPSRAEPESDPCRGQRFDLLAPPAACIGRAAPKADETAFEARLTVSPAKVAPGKETQVTLELTNRSSVATELSYAVDCLAPEVQAYRRGKRADLLSTPSADLLSCAKVVRLVVEPGGVLVATLPFQAVRRKTGSSMMDLLGPKVVGPLAAGAYELRLAVGEFPLATVVRTLRATLEVGR